jgi:nicotinic acid mononucleotide adenylyltransferase
VRAVAQAPVVDRGRTVAGGDGPWIEPLTGEPDPGRPIALLAGSFDPPTIAHVALALGWRTGSGGDVVLVYAERTLPKGSDAEPPLLDDERRLKALGRVAAAHEGLVAARASHGLLVDQAEAAHDRWPAPPLTILVGSDKARQLFDAAWYEDRDTALDRLFAVAEVCVAERVGEEGLVAAVLDDPANARYRDRVAAIALPTDVAAVSSSEVRRRLRSGRPVADLVPPEVVSLLRG